MEANIGSDNALVLPGSQPLHEPMLTSYKAIYAEISIGMRPANGRRRCYNMSLIGWAHT